MASAIKRAQLGCLAALAASVIVAASLSAPALAYEQRENVVAYGHGSNSASYLVVHETANPGATAWNHVQYWAGSPAYAVHYVMDLDGSVVYHTMPDWALAWHVGNGNYASVGIELCHATSASDFEAQWDEAVQWCAGYLGSRGWGIERMLSHNECRVIWGGTDHTDPLSYFASYGRSWSEFKQDVAAAMGGSYVPDTSKSPDGSSFGYSSDVNVTYAAYVPGYGWLDWVTNYGAGSDGFAGIPCRAMTYVAVKVDRGEVMYQAHTIGGQWLPMVYGCDTSDYVHGCAGNGEAIDGVMVYYRTTQGDEWHQAYYRSQTVARVGYLPVCSDDGTNGDGLDGWAGIYGEGMDRLQIAIDTSNPY